MLQQDLKNGHQKALERTYQIYFDRLYAFILKSTFNQSITSDLVQDTFLKLWQNREKISIELPLEQQLFVIAKNLIIDHYRKRLNEEKVINEFVIFQSHTNTDLEARKQLLEKLYLHIEKLPPQQKEVFRLLKFRGLQYEEVAEKMQISKNTVANHYRAALLFLKKHCLLAVLFIPFIG